MRAELAEHGFRFCTESLEAKLEKQKLIPADEHTGESGFCLQRVHFTLTDCDSSQRRRSFSGRRHVSFWACAWTREPGTERQCCAWTKRSRTTTALWRSVDRSRATPTHRYTQTQPLFGATSILWLFVGWCRCGMEFFSFSKTVKALRACL